MSCLGCDVTPAPPPLFALAYGFCCELMVAVENKGCVTVFGHVAAVIKLPGTIDAESIARMRAPIPRSG